MAQEIKYRRKAIARLDQKAATEGIAPDTTNKV